MKEQSTNRHPLYQAALDADAAFEALLLEVYGPKLAPEGRYRTPFAHFGLRMAHRAKVEADRAWLKIMEADHVS